MSAAVTERHLIMAMNAVDPTTPSAAGRTERVAQALADAEQRGRELERSAVVRYLHAKAHGGSDLSRAVVTGAHLEPATKEEPTDGKA